MINIHIRKFYALTDVELNPGVGGSKILVDSVGGGNVAEVIKLAFGTEGNLTLVSAADELPVTDPAAASIDLKTPTVGQKVMAASSPVAIASDQSAIPISAASLPLPSGAAIAANQQTDALTNTQLRAVPVPISGTVTVDTSALLTTADFDTKTGSLTETAPATDTASSGLNGRLQRIAQRITSLITALGSPFQAGGSIGNTTFAATQATAANLNMTEASAAAILAKVTAAASSFVKLEDVAAADGDAGVPAFAVRKATPANSSGTDGDYEPLQMNAGKLWVQAGATQKPSIGATVVLAVTALQSMTTSLTVGWKSVRVSNLATLATDYEIFVSITTANTAPASSKSVQVFIIPWYTTDGGSTWFSSSGGTATLPTSADATYTIASPHNFRLLGVLNYSTAQMVLQDTFLLSNCFGNRLPDGWSLFILNDSGATLSTGCVADYSPINDILV